MKILKTGMGRKDLFIYFHLFVEFRSPRKRVDLKCMLAAGYRSGENCCLKAGNWCVISLLGRTKKGSVCWHMQRHG